MNKIIKILEEKVIAKSKPAVYISGGIDSTIVLHHLTQKSKEPLYTYTAKFKMNGDEWWVTPMNYLSRYN